MSGIRAPESDTDVAVIRRYSVRLIEMLHLSMDALAFGEEMRFNLRNTDTIFLISSLCFSQSYIWFEQSARIILIHLQNFVNLHKEIDQSFKIPFHFLLQSFFFFLPDFIFLSRSCLVGGLTNCFYFILFSQKNLYI